MTYEMSHNYEAHYGFNDHHYPYPQQHAMQHEEHSNATFTYQNEQCVQEQFFADHSQYDVHCDEHCEWLTTSAAAVPDVSSRRGCEPNSCCSSGNSQQDYEQMKNIYREISAECEHLLMRSECGKCNEVSIAVERPQPMPVLPIENDLLEIVDTVLKQHDDELENSKTLLRKRMQNKEAAARYRNKQKNKLAVLMTEVTKEEERKAELLKRVADLEGEVAALRAKIFQAV